MEEEGLNYIDISCRLDQSGLVWHPEIGDEVAERGNTEKVCILIDPQGMTPGELREKFVWLPTLEQLFEQFEARNAVVYHAGMGEQQLYEAIIKTSSRVIEAAASTLRIAMGEALESLLSEATEESLVH